MTYIYAIQHNITKKIYIGKTKNVEKRYFTHLYELRKNKHKCQDMQKDFYKFGEDFSVYVLEEIENGKEEEYYNGRLIPRDRIREVYWMEKYNTLTDGYNVQDFQSKKMLNPKNFPFKQGLPEVKEE